MLAAIRAAAPRSGDHRPSPSAPGWAAVPAPGPGRGRREGAGRQRHGDRGGRRCRGRRPGRGRRRRGRRRGRPPELARDVVGEELPPALAHRRRVATELLVHVVDQPGVGPEGPAGERGAPGPAVLVERWPSRPVPWPPPYRRHPPATLRTGPDGLPVASTRWPTPLLPSMFVVHPPLGSCTVVSTSRPAIPPRRGHEEAERWSSSTDRSTGATASPGWSAASTTWPRHLRPPRLPALRAARDRPADVGRARRRPRRRRRRPSGRRRPTARSPWWATASAATWSHWAPRWRRPERVRGDRRLRAAAALARVPPPGGRGRRRCRRATGGSRRSGSSAGWSGDARGSASPSAGGPTAGRRAGPGGRPASPRRGRPSTSRRWRLPAIFGRRGRTAPRTTSRGAWLARPRPRGRARRDPRAGHGAHLSHPTPSPTLFGQVMRAGVASRRERRGDEGA